MNNLKVELVGHTTYNDPPDFESDSMLENMPSLVAYEAAKVCYNPNFSIYNEEETLKTEDVLAYIKKIAGSGHDSILEHCSATFKISGVSRILSHQLVRHRIASYTQRSQRYSSDDATEAVIPDTIKNNKDACEIYINHLASCQSVYTRLQHMGIPMEDARYSLPSSATTTVYLTMNYRALINFFGLRMCMRAQSEIRKLANSMYNHMKSLDPVVFGHNTVSKGAVCQNEGFCKEEKSCMKMPHITMML